MKESPQMDWSVSYGDNINDFVKIDINYQNISIFVNVASFC